MNYKSLIVLAALLAFAALVFAEEKRSADPEADNQKRDAEAYDYYSYYYPYSYGYKFGGHKRSAVADA
ncbi:4608_t:CDS:2 [Acaulospora morrowiae]|uniref:4608_t:CDS:1 n=1 Tax=Acaulospora morrowiae TaxID=94023 RepID=A0A9N9GCE2_9GLOM|nr:4608_t:CDS:2 [Acaulospora morrowiae]